MKFSAFPFAAGWLLIGFAWQIWPILAGRVLCGFAIGVVAPASPTYICEIAESRIRGALASIGQLSVTGGILLAYGVGAGKSSKTRTSVEKYYIKGAQNSVFLLL
jgi:MFS family permease